MKMKALMEFCDLNMGQSPNSETYNEENIGLPFFQGNADFGEVYPKVRIWCSSPVKVAAVGDILISVRAPIGAMNIANTPCCIGRGLAALSPNPDTCMREYLYYALQSRIDWLIAQGTGSTFKAIGRKTLEGTQIPAYSLDEQQIISDTLSKTDQLITKAKAQASLLDELVKSRFVEMFGEPATNPMGWMETTVGRECYSIKDGPHVSLPDIGRENGGHPFISVRNIVNHVIDLSTARYISDEDFASARKKCCPQKGDMLYSKGGTTGIAKLIDVDVEFANWVHLAVLKYDKGKLNGVFFENMLNCDYCYGQSQKLTKGIANRDLVLSAIAQIKIYRPPVELQKRFAAFVAEVDKSKLAVKQSLEKLETLKKSLMQQYFS